MRLQSPTDQEISEMVRLYVSGLSLAAVSKNVGMSVGTVKRYVVQYGVDMRDTHGRLC
jgi:transposase